MCDLHFGALEVDVGDAVQWDEVHVGVSGLGGLFGALGPRVTCQEDEDAIRIEVVAVPVPLAAADCGGGGGLRGVRGGGDDCDLTL